MKNSKIEWTDHTFNPWVGCTRVSPGCQHCYAETLMADRYKKVKWGPQGERIRTSADYWRQPLKWNREAAAAGERRRVFCASLADVFEYKRDQSIDMHLWRTDLFSLIRMTPHLDWLLLTKRPELIFPIAPWFVEKIEKYPNVWIGTSVENQEQADKRIPELLNIPAAVRFLSVEPLLGPVDITQWLSCDTCLDRRVHWCGANLVDWVIVGGESGRSARPMHPDWVRSIRNQCQEAGVPFFFKQWGNWLPYEYVEGTSFWKTPDGGIHDGHLLDITDPETGDVGKGWLDIGVDITLSACLFRSVGKKPAGRVLDGIEWSQFPSVKEQPAMTQEATSNDEASVIEPWTRAELMAALREAGWVRMKGATGTYVSPDDPEVHFTLDNYRPGFGVSWRYFAGRNELPATTRPPF